MDGTLVDTEGLYVQSLQAACKDRHIILGAAEANKIIYGKAWSSSYADIDRIYPGLFKSCEDLQQSCAGYFEGMLINANIAIQPSVDLLKELSVGTMICIVSGSSRNHIDHFVKELNIADQVQFYLGNEDYTNGKPHPECFLKAAEIAGAETHECLVFEDSYAGVSAAKNAGMKCIGFKNDQNPQDISHSDLLVKCLSHFSFRALNEKCSQLSNF